MQILRLPEVKKITGLSTPTIYRHIKKGTFPEPIKLGERAVGWIESDIHQWIESRIKGVDSSCNQHLKPE